MLRKTVLLLAVATIVPFSFLRAQKALVFEVEKYTTPEDAWQKDTYSSTKWNLWSTDKDAKKKWSEGILFQGPTVREDRSTPEEGAPVLHTVLTDLPNGRYNVEVTPSTRTIGVSLDGKTWTPFEGGLVARNVTVTDGTFELWVDDRYTNRKGEPGPCYYDTIRLYPVFPGVNGISNPDFEAVSADGGTAGWSYWSREGKGKAESVTTEKHAGERCVRVTHDGERDWNLTSSERFPVKPGQEFSINGWAKNDGENAVDIAVVGCDATGKVVSWTLGRARSNPNSPWKHVKGYLQIPETVSEVYVRLAGKGATDVYVDDLELKKDKFVAPVMPKVYGSAKTRVEERMDRGVVALRTPQGVYVGWRLLKSDAPDITFDVFRSDNDGPAEKVNPTPIRYTTDFLDTGAPADSDPVYTVRPTDARQNTLRKLFRLRPTWIEGSARTTTVGEGTPYVSFKLDGEHKFQKIGIADLDGDGQYDYVIKQPNKNIDPWIKYWYKSPETYKLEAYKHDGTFMWRIDLGWGIERGIWYSPYIVYDLDGDGKAEVAAKMGEGDPREEDGRVQKGPEWVVVWNGETGEEITRAPWPSRDGFVNYNKASRNQLAVAYLDGKTPCLITLRGTYGRMKAEAYEFTGKELRPLWKYDNEPYGRRYWGQGAHFTHAVDVDNDGRDEVVLGSAVLDDTGAPLWSTGLGHPDHSYWGDIDPHRPGMEVYYGIETRNPKNGMCLVDVATGEFIWGLEEPTKHVHSVGLCADIDPTHAGMECYGADADGHKLTDHRWLRSASGEFLDCPQNFGFGVRNGYWDADLQREILRGSIIDYQGGKHADRTRGSIVLVADILGDWREEIITSEKGELRIYSSTIPATDRRVCLMQDPIYRLDVAMCAMGYTPIPTTSYCLEAQSPGLNVTVLESAETPTCRVVVSAPLDRPVQGTLELSAHEAELSPRRIDINVPAGERVVKMVAVRSDASSGLETVIHASLSGVEAPLRGQVRVQIPSKPLTGVPMAQAETFAGEGGGKVRIRDDKVGVVEKALSHWDDKGHWLSWNVKEPAGQYKLVVRYSASATARRKLTIDGRDCGIQVFQNSGGFGSNAAEWDHATMKTGDTPLLLKLDGLEHTLRLENVDGKGLNLDYLALVPVK